MKNAIFVDGASGTLRKASSATRTSLRKERHVSLSVKSFGIVTPYTSEGTSLQKYVGSDTVSVVNTKLLYVKYSSHNSTSAGELAVNNIKCVSIRLQSNDTIAEDGCQDFSQLSLFTSALKQHQIILYKVINNHILLIFNGGYVKIHYGSILLYTFSENRSAYTAPSL